MAHEFSPTSSSAATLPDETLPAEEQVVVVPPTGFGVQRLSSSLVTALYLGVHSAFGPTTRLNLSTSFGWIERVENATTALIVSDVASKQAILEALNCQSPEELQDGMTARLGVKLAACLRNFGDACLANLATVALQGEADPDALSHVLRWVGRLPDRESIQGRLLLLIRALEAPSAIVRDGAGLGLVELGSRAAIPALTAAIARETNASLRDDLEQAAAHLLST